VRLEQVFYDNNIHVFYLHKSLTVDGFLKSFVKKGDHNQGKQTIAVSDENKKQWNIFKTFCFMDAELLPTFSPKL